MANPQAPTIRMDKWGIRCLFNRGRYWARLKAGEFTPRVHQGRSPSKESGQPQYTKTQEVRYIDNNNVEVARVHQFVLPDGTLGASKHPDPKELFRDGIRYREPKAKDVTPPTAWEKSWPFRAIMFFWEPIRCWCWWLLFRDDLHLIGRAEFALPNSRQGTMRVVFPKPKEGIECDVDMDGNLAFRVTISRSTLTAPTPGTLLPMVIARVDQAMKARNWAPGGRHSI